MKNILLVLSSLFIASAANAKILYLNNNLSEPNIAERLYIDWTNVYAAASAGDTIYVVGSNFSHGDIVISKPITLIGPGYFLDENGQTQVDKKNAQFGRITLDNGADGSVLQGLSCPTSFREIRINAVRDIMIENCYAPGVYINTLDGFTHNNILVRRCYFYNTSLSHNSFRNGVLTNFIFANNIVIGTVQIPNGSTGIISNNLFLSNTLRFGSSSSFEIADNIYVNTDDTRFTIQPLPDAAVHNNISITGVFGNDNSNFVAPASTLFIGDTNASTDGQYQLAASSPARNAGTSGRDIGPYGGPAPYRLSGVPSLPNIYELVTGGFISGDNLPVRIKIRQQ